MIKTAVCIVGAGPAGASTSLMLSKLKINHYIVDKAAFPRDKTCGDGLILQAYKSLKILDLFDEFLKLPEFIHSKKVNLHINNNLKVDISETPERDMVISYGKRIHFDYFLIKKLSKEYAKVLLGNGLKKLKNTNEGVLITLKDGTEILAKVVVGADGIASKVSKSLGGNLPNKTKTSTFISSYFKNVNYNDNKNEAEIRVCYKKIPLFFYIFPLANNEANISLGGNTAQILKHNINLKQEIDTILKTHPKIAHKFTDASQIGNWRGWGIPYNFKNQKVAGNRFLLVGDAAGLANAFYKEGVGTGMMSGILCAKKIANCLKEDNFSDQFMQSYKKDLEKEFAKLLRFSEFVLKLSYKKMLFSFLFKMVKKRVEKRVKSIILKRSY